MVLGVDDVLEGAAVPAVLVGVGLVVAAPFLIAGSRPAAKKVLHAYLDAADKLKGAAAETKEMLADLLAEVQAEREVQAAAAMPAAKDTTDGGAAEGA